MILTNHPRFGIFWCARGASALAFQMQAVAVGWQIYALTHSTFALGMVGLAQFLPMFLCTLPAGHAADRWDRRTLAALSVATLGVVIGLLALGNHGGWMSPSLLFSAVAVVGAARTFERPASQALLPALVPASEFSQAIAWSTAVFQIASIVGPSVGGILYAWNPSICYGTAAVLGLVSAGLFASIATEKTRRPATTLASLFSGIHFIRRQPVILGSISLDLFAVLLGGATALLPAFAKDILGVGAWGLGALRSAPMVGALAMSGILLISPLRRRAGPKMFAAVIAFGLATIVFGLSRSFALSFAALVVLGAADMVSVVVRGSLVQLRTPDEMRGRVSAVNGLFIGTSNQLGEFESGITAAWWGTVPATVVGGIGTLIVALAWIKAFPELAACDRLENRPSP